jgi:hypothetical protein
MQLIFIDTNGVLALMPCAYGLSNRSTLVVSRSLNLQEMIEPVALSILRLTRMATGASVVLDEAGLEAQVK